MSRITDLTETDEQAEILTSTSTSGLLGGGEILAGDPPETYLHEGEEPKYVLRNKKAGLRISKGEITEEIEPADEYQAVSLVTDLRVVFLIGMNGGDEMIELPLTQVIEAKSESDGFRTTALSIETVAEETWQFACTDDLSEVATEIDEMAQVWANAQRLLDETEQQLSNSDEELNARNIDLAREELGDAEEKIRTAVERIETVGPAAKSEVESRARGLAGWLLDVERMLTADEAARAHRSAQQDWEQRRYESASEKYERAIDGYKRALSTDGPTPDDETLWRRLAGIVTERELLRIAPVVDADTARRRAMANEDPEKAATEWEQALDGYRELLTLDWGKESGEFTVDKEEIKEQTIAIADDAIEDHVEAGKQWIQSADKLAVEDHEEQAREVYQRAHHQFELAEQLAREVRPEQLETIEEAVKIVDSRLSGSLPNEVPDVSPMETVVLKGHSSGTERSQAETGSKDVTADVAQSTSPEAAVGAKSESGAQSTAQSEAESSPGRRSPLDGTGDATLLDEIQQQKDSGNPATAEVSSDVDGSPPARESPPEQEPQPDGEPREGDDPGTGSEPGTQDEPERASESQLDVVKTLLEDLSESQFDTLVTELWEAQGWTTMQFSVEASSAFDIIAFRERPAEERLGIWTVHETTGAVNAAVVNDCVEARKGSRGADVATIVTTTTVTTGGESSAEANDITIVDSAELSKLLTFEKLTDRLEALAEQE